MRNDFLQKATMALGKLAFLKKGFTALRVILTADHVPEEQVLKRLDICASCDKSILLEDGRNQASIKCGICGCSSSNNMDSILNLALYEETPSSGCKYVNPETRQRQSKWKDAGC